MTVIEFLDEALEEAEDAARWYAERSSEAAAAFVEELERSVAEIQRAPGTWPAYEYDTRRFLLARFPFSIVYRVEPNRLVVVAVSHAHRRPGYWKGRISSAS